VYVASPLLPRTLSQAPSLEQGKASSALSPATSARPAPVSDDALPRVVRAYAYAYYACPCLSRHLLHCGLIPCCMAVAASCSSKLCEELGPVYHLSGANGLSTPHSGTCHAPHVGSQVALVTTLNPAQAGGASRL
jgi:hypothetical protein